MYVNYCIYIEGGILYTIGWEITEDIFEPQINVCFHHDQETTSYVYHRVYGQSMDAKTIDPKWPGFKTAKMYGNYCIYILFLYVIITVYSFPMEISPMGLFGYKSLSKYLITYHSVLLCNYLYTLNKQQQLR